MKRFLLVCFLLTAVCSVSYIQHASAQITPPTPTTLADFTAKVNLMDTYIGAGNMPMAQSTWLEIHTMMKNVLAVSKYSIYSAATPADKDAHIAILNNQTTIYFRVWALKNDLATNRVAIHTKLNAFGATIY
jgi:hypothetical protein